MIDEEISKLLHKGILVHTKTSVDEFISNVFVREKKDGSFRMILNLSDFNESVVYQQFKIETLHSIVQLIRPNSFACSIDLKSAYYTVPVAPEH